ncbi:pre-mrna-processing factor [Stylonychia lemnae]|uniref:Pre-mrna-processing factor n=1 Tax=Stylonychia lemnae TaxID=5949 RepID=A0A078AL73_STYLE|nr:pre-mrna-processing factor [Stylonychia lemnae]|eukprot:CDW82944.1 pre-mrna-processing factor [Stylonychia lemnae]
MSAVATDQLNLQQLFSKAFNLEQYIAVIQDICNKDPLNYIYVHKLANLLVAQNKIAEAQECYEKSLRYNSAQVELWKRFVDFAMEIHYFTNQEEDKCKQIFERAVDNVGQHMKGLEIWTKYMDFETTLNHMSFVNLLGYLSVKTPLIGTEEAETKYLEIIENLYDPICEEVNNPEIVVPEKYKAKYEELVKLMFQTCNGDKFEFIAKIKEISAETKSRVDLRLVFENKIISVWKDGLTLEEEKKIWIDYIKFEISQDMQKRAKLLYERALISLDKDKHFWISYIQFIEKNLKDPQLARAKFENRIKHADKYETVDFMIENALFEEEQQQVQKSRRIYENLQNEIAPDYIKSLIAFINFEKRQNNNEKVKELYFRAYSSSQQKNEIETVSYVVIQYARFLAFKCQDPNRAVEILNQALSKTKGSKMLYLSYANFLKHMDGVIPEVYGKITQIFEKGIDHSQSGLNDDDRSELARFYFEYLQENCSSVAILRNTEQILKEKGLLYGQKQKQESKESKIEIKVGNSIDQNGIHDNGYNNNGDNNYAQLGKRDQPDNGHFNQYGDQPDKRQKF